MAGAGPAGIRLQEVAQTAGVSHPTVLHHFGSREGLIQALNQRTLAELKAVLVGMIEAAEGPAGAMGLAFEAYRNGLARRMVWLLQADSDPNPASLGLFEDIVEAVHALRLRLSGPNAQIDRYDTRAAVHLATVAAFGDALIGSRLRGAAGDADEASERQRFEQWFAKVLQVYMRSLALASATELGI